MVELCAIKLPVIFHSQIRFLVGSEINIFNHKTSTSKKAIPVKKEPLFEGASLGQ